MNIILIKPKRSVLLHFRSVVLIFLGFIILSSCHKSNIGQTQHKTYSVTYTFKNTAPCYYIQIWDGTQLKDFADSIRTPIFTKTIVYDYSGTERCRIDNAKGAKSDMSIAITYNGTTNTATSNLFPSLESFILTK